MKKRTLFCFHSQAAGCNLDSGNSSMLLQAPAYQNCYAIEHPGLRREYSGFIAVVFAAMKASAKLSFLFALRCIKGKCLSSGLAKVI
jgi:hypothetical protein